MRADKFLSVFSSNTKPSLLVPVALRSRRPEKRRKNFFFHLGALVPPVGLISPATIRDLPVHVRGTWE
jgi:hypothetical protein